MKLWNVQFGQLKTTVQAYTIIEAIHRAIYLLDLNVNDLSQLEIKEGR